MAKNEDYNLDPITKEPGAHPIGTGLGTASGAVAGAAVGTFGGPAGVVVGGIAGAVAGGLGGKAAAEAVNPTAEDDYWRNHYQLQPHYEQGRVYEDYAPAYRLGWSSRSEYQGSFDDADTSLADRWERTKESSKLSWIQAREATRAAWDRVSGQTVAGDGDMLDDDEVVDVLNDLLERTRDGEYGFRECAEHTRADDIRILLARRADDCSLAALDLQALIRQYGGTPDDGGSISGALHRGWVSVRGILGGYTDQAMLDEAERGEDVALASYRKALKQNLPQSARAVVERQLRGVQKNHDQVKALRDALKASHRTDSND